MKHIKTWNHEFFSFFKENLVISLLYLLAPPLLTLAWLQMYSSKHHTDIPLCFADYFIVTKDGIFFFVVIVLMSVLLCAFLNKNDFNINRIIRVKNSHQLWIKQSYFSMLVAFIISLYLLLINSVTGLFNFTVLINFSQKQSQFGLANQGVTTNQVSVWTVIAVTFVFGFLMLVFMNQIYQLVKWIANKDAIGLVALIILGYCNCGEFGLGSVIGVYYTKWLPYHFTNLLILGFISVVIYISGLYYSNHKEFLNAKQV